MRKRRNEIQLKKCVNLSIKPHSGNLSALATIRRTFFVKESQHFVLNYQARLKQRRSTKQQSPQRIRAVEATTYICNKTSQTATKAQSKKVITTNAFKHSAYGR